jgi:hypothetical protein
VLYCVFHCDTSPEVENIFHAVQEWSDDFMEKVWYAYLVNDSDFLMESVMVVSKAFGTIDGEMKKTSLLRHAFGSTCSFGGKD